MSDGSSLAALLRERSAELLASWGARFERSPLRFRRAAQASAHTAQVGTLLEALAVAASAGELGRGTPATRELERSAAFLGARFASEGATGFDIAAVLLELRDVVRSAAPADDAAALGALFEWLVVIALDTFASSGVQSLRERVSDQLETGTPVVELLPRVPAVLLVAAPSPAVLEGLLARAWMLAVGTGAPCLIIDSTGLAEPAEAGFVAAYQAFLEEAEGSALQVLLAGARRPLRERITAVSSERARALQYFDRLDSAVVHALERAGHLLTRRA